MNVFFGCVGLLHLNLYFFLFFDNSNPRLPFLINDEWLGYIHYWDRNHVNIWTNQYCFAPITFQTRNLSNICCIPFIESLNGPPKQQNLSVYLPRPTSEPGFSLVRIYWIERFLRNSRRGRPTNKIKLWIWFWEKKSIFHRVNSCWLTTKLTKQQHPHPYHHQHS